MEQGNGDFKYDTLAIIDLDDRKLSDVEFTTAVQTVGTLPRTTKTLINPNTVIVIDERDKE